MKRFRFTILAVCLILAWLGYADLSVMVRNPEPQRVTLTELETTGAPRAWLTVTGGYRNLLEGINMTGTMDIDAFLIPLKHSPDAESSKVWIETRNPAIISALKTYYFELDTDPQREAFLAENHELFFGQHDVTGMVPASLIANSNRQKLVRLLEEMNIPTSDEIIFISSGKKPVVWRGILFSIIALLGVLKIAKTIKREK